MLCLGPKKSLPSPGLELTAQGIAYRCSKVECEDHSAIQAPLNHLMFIRLTLIEKIHCPEFYTHHLVHRWSYLRITSRCWQQSAAFHIPSCCCCYEYDILSYRRAKPSSHWVFLLALKAGNKNLTHFSIQKCIDEFLSVLLALPGAKISF